MGIVPDDTIGRVQQRRGLGGRGGFTETSRAIGTVLVNAAVAYVVEERSSQRVRGVAVVVRGRGGGGGVGGVAGVIDGNGAVVGAIVGSQGRV